MLILTADTLVRISTSQQYDTVWYSGQGHSEFKVYPGKTRQNAGQDGQGTIHKLWSTYHSVSGRKLNHPEEYHINLRQ